MIFNDVKVREREKKKEVKKNVCRKIRIEYHVPLSTVAHCYHAIAG